MSTPHFSGSAIEDTRTLKQLPCKIKKGYMMPDLHRNFIQPQRRQGNFIKEILKSTMKKVKQGGIIEKLYGDQKFTHVYPVEGVKLYCWKETCLE